MKKEIYIDNNCFEPDLLRLKIQPACGLNFAVSVRMAFHFQIVSTVS
jgi:hypothetical protein